jgi:hypothetical protein
MSLHQLHCKFNKGIILLPVVFTLTILAAVAYLLSYEGAINAGNASREQQQNAALYVAQAGYNHAIWQLKKNQCTGYTDIPATSFAQYSYLVTLTDTLGATVTEGSPVNIKVDVKRPLVDKVIYSINRSQVKLYKSSTASQELVLQPDGTDGKDTWVTSGSPTNNFGAASQTTFTTTGNNKKYFLSKFDVSSIPLGSQIISAKLALYHDAINGNSVGEFSLYSMQQGWEEGSGNWSASGDGATWNTSDGSTPWSWDSNHDSNVISTSSVSNSAAGWQEWDMAALVQDWVAGEKDNYGVLVKSNENIGGAEFYSSDSWSNRPKLTITYSSTCECGQC